MANAYYSQDLQRLVAQANRVMNAERARQDKGGEVATEEGRIALKFAQKELDRIYGYNQKVQRLSLSGVTDPEQIQKIQEAAERITGSKLLTAKGRREVEQKRMETFFGVDRGKITSRERKIWKELTASGGLFDMLHEMEGVESPSKTVQDAIKAMKANGFTGEQITEALYKWAKANAAATAENRENIVNYINREYPGFDWKAGR